MVSGEFIPELQIRETVEKLVGGGVNTHAFYCVVMPGTLDEVAETAPYLAVNLRRGSADDSAQTTTGINLEIYPDEFDRFVQMMSGLPIDPNQERGPFQDPVYLVLERTFRTVAEMVRECVEGQGLNYKADSE